MIIVHVDGEPLMVDCAFVGPTPCHAMSLSQAEPEATLGGNRFSIRSETLPHAEPREALGADGFTLYRHVDGSEVAMLWINPCPSLPCDIKMLDLCVDDRKCR